MGLAWVLLWFTLFRKTYATGGENRMDEVVRSSLHFAALVAAVLRGDNSCTIRICKASAQRRWREQACRAGQ